MTPDSDIMSQMETGTDVSTLIGAVVASRFRIDALIGTGAMGVVFRASMLDHADRDARRAGAPVALKVVLPDGKQQRSVPRLLRGARLAAQVKHPHVVETLAHGRVGRDQDGYYVAMELIEGVTLGRVAAAELSVGAICTLMAQVLDALAHMHARGILHRDIKPENILVTRGPDGDLVCKISDFGIAAEAVTDATYLTQPGTVIGTPMYMAPEQMQGRARDTPTLDLYPVGVILYELLGGRLPFPGHSLGALMAKLSEDPPPIEPRDGLALPPGLSDVIMRLLAREPADRYPFAADARGALEPFCAPATLSAEGWRELLDWDARHRHDWELPAGWSADPGALAAGTDQSPAQQAVELPVVGRDDLLAALADMAGEAELGQVRAALLRGGVGMGKSALLGELATRLAECGRFHVVRAGFHATGSTSDALRLALDSAFGTAGRGVTQVRHAIHELMRRAGDEDPDELQALAGFLRPAGGASLEQGEIFALVHRCLRRMARVRPVLLAIDDLQSGGPDAVAFLDFLLFQATYEPFPLLIATTARTECRSAVFRSMLERATRLDGTVLRSFDLGPVDEGVLARALAAHMGLGQTRARSIARRAAGNPLIAVLMARGDVSEQSGADQAMASTAPSDTGGDTGERVPRALHEMLELSLQHRLDESAHAGRLRTLLETIAVLGAAVHVSLLEAFLRGDELERTLDDDLDRCLDLEILQWSDSGGAEVVAFTPAVLRDVVLGGLNPRRARRLHRRAVDVRQAWAGDRVDAEAGALGDHCEALGQRDQAIDWWLRGQRHEREGGDALQGVEWGLKALSAMEPADPRHGPCAIALGRTLLDAGDLERAETVLVPVAFGADPDLAMRAGDVLGDVYENRGDDASWTRLIKTLSTREQEASPAGRRSLYTARSMWNNYHGCLTQGRHDAERALAGAEPGEQAQRAAQRLGYLLIFRGEHERAEAVARRAVDEAGTRSDLRTRSLRMLGLVLQCLGRFEESLAQHQEVLALCRRSGLRARIAIALGDVGNALSLLGRVDEARDCYVRAERVARELGMHTSVESIQLRLVLCDLTEGRAAGALARLQSLRAGVTATNKTALTQISILAEAWAHALDERVDDALATMADLHGQDEIPRLITPISMLQTFLDCLIETVEARGASADQRAAIARWLDVADRLAGYFPATELPQRGVALRARLAALPA